MGLQYYFRGMAHYGLYAIPVLFLFRVVRICTLRKQRVHTTVLHEVGVWLFWLSVVGIASQTVVPRFATLADGSFGPVFGGGSINLIPFKVFYNSYQWIFVQGHPYYFVLYFIGNILLFVPIGFFASLLWKRLEGKCAVLLTFAFSLLIELTQLLLPRETDIDDIWLNTLGGFLGLLLFCLMRKILPELVEKFRLRENRKWTAD